MTLWEFAACMHGYREAHRTDEAPAPEMGDETLAKLGIVGF